MEELPMLPTRRKHIKVLATDEEKSFAESVVGSLGWFSRQLRMDVSFGYSWLAQQKNVMTVQDLLEMNKLV
eukprot:7209087-Pyramimonas_sp.AAC.1